MSGRRGIRNPAAPIARLQDQLIGSAVRIPEPLGRPVSIKPKQPDSVPCRATVAVAKDHRRRVGSQNARAPRRRHAAHALLPPRLRLVHDSTPLLHALFPRFFRFFFTFPLTSSRTALARRAGSFLQSACAGDRGATNHAVRREALEGQLRRWRLRDATPGARETASYIVGMSRPERDRPEDGRSWCCTRLTGASPVAVSAGAPRSRLRVTSERAASERSVESPAGAIGFHAREANLRAQCESVNFAAP